MRTVDRRLTVFATSNRAGSKIAEQSVREPGDGRLDEVSGVVAAHRSGIEHDGEPMGGAVAIAAGGDEGRARRHRFTGEDVDPGVGGTVVAQGHLVHGFADGQVQDCIEVVRQLCAKAFRRLRSGWLLDRRGTPRTREVTRARSTAIGVPASGHS